MSDNIWLRKGFMGKIWGFESIKKEDVNISPLIAQYGNIPDYHYTRVDYSFMHRNEKYFARWIRMYPDNPDIETPGAPRVWVFKDKEVFFEAKVKPRFLAYPVELLVFSPGNEWHVTLLARLKAFINEAVRLRAELRNEESLETQL